MNISKSAGKLTGKLGFGLTTAVLAVGYIWLIKPLIYGPERLNCDDLASSERPAVVMYGTDWCQFCKRTRWFLEDHKVAYCEYNIEQSEQGAREFAALNGQPIPLIMVNDQRLEGFNTARLAQVLSTQGLLDN